MEPDSGGAVRAMDLRMAVGATAVECESRGSQLRRGRMLCRDVALLAEPGHAGLQQLRASGTMRIMAVGAIFHHRRMLPQERAAPFCVTLVAGLVDCLLDE